MMSVSPAVRRLTLLTCSLVALLGAARASASQTHALERAPWAAGESRAEDLRVSLLTFGPGSEVASLFGHSALLVEDTALHQSRVYNYGMFSFDRTLLVRYALGKLTFWLGEASLEGTLRIYARQGRDIVAQELLLEPADRAALAGFMAWNARPENRGYLYDHFADNCATRPRDVINRFTGGALQRHAARAARMSLRDNVRRYTEVQPLAHLLFDFLMNQDVERRLSAWDELFLPALLAAEIEAAGVAAAPRVIARAVDRPPIAPAPPRVAPWLFALGLAVGGLGVLLAWQAQQRRGFLRLFGLHQLVVGLVFGVPGLVLALMWAITEHTVSYANENLLLASPLTLAAAPFGMVLIIKRCQRSMAALEAIWLALAVTSAFALVAKLTPWFGQDNGALLALFLPINLAGALAIARLRRPRGPPAA